MKPLTDKECNICFGNPDADNIPGCDPTFMKDNIIVMTLPWPMRNSWGNQSTITKIQIHKTIEPFFRNAMNRVLNNMNHAQIIENNYDILGGSFNFRHIVGYPQYLSRHSWGIALDICPTLGPLGDIKAKETFPKIWIDAMVMEGFYWGGWFSRCDAMHFEPSDIMLQMIMREKK